MSKINIENRIGEEVKNKFGSKMILINWRKFEDIDVYFPQYNWIAYNMNYGNFKNGGIACPYEPRVFGAGYIGEGEMKMKKGYTQNDSYVAWKGIIERCYDEKCKRFGSTMSKEWLCFNCFNEWFKKNIYYVENQRMCVDKDILFKGNKHYSEKTCCIVPNDINVLFTNSRKTRGDLPLGVSKTQNGKFRARCSVYNEEILIGIYNTVEEAFLAYKFFKENHIKEVADLYKDIIPYNLYNAMYNYKIEFDD